MITGLHILGYLVFQILTKQVLGEGVALSHRSGDFSCNFRIILFEHTICLYKSLALFFVLYTVVEMSTHTHLLVEVLAFRRPQVSAERGGWRHHPPRLRDAGTWHPVEGTAAAVVVAVVIADALSPVRKGLAGRSLS